MYHTTGFTCDELIDICILVTSVDREPDAAMWPPCLGLFNSVVAALSYMRHNRTQAEIGESLGVSQPTVSRAITVVTPLLSAALAEYAPTADELDQAVQYIVDGTLLPCWSWAGHKELYSGKHVCHERWRSPRDTAKS
jgi:Helix-turn-helix of DDE superfamily endonuclease